MQEIIQKQATAHIKELEREEKMIYKISNEIEILDCYITDIAERVKEGKHE